MIFARVQLFVIIYHLNHLFSVVWLCYFVYFFGVILRLCHGAGLVFRIRFYRAGCIFRTMTNCVYRRGSGMFFRLRMGYQRNGTR